MPPTASEASPIDHYENFPVASWLCPAHLRRPIAAIYHFARTGDDLADEGQADATQRLQELQAYRQQLVLACQTPMVLAQDFEARWCRQFVALQEAVHVHQLPPECLQRLLDAFVQDVEMTRDGAVYADQAELLAYCQRSANPIGRLLLHLYDVSDALSLQRSDAICTALQLINFWQDLSQDIPRGRYYLPLDQCAHFGLTPAAMRSLHPSPQARALVAACVAEARHTLLQGAALVHSIRGRAGWELRLVVQGGLRMLERIEALQFATFVQRPTLRRRDYALMLWRALWM
ncbi:MAG: squalene synthase HpnC [Rhodoferax sp.]